MALSSPIASILGMRAAPRQRLPLRPRGPVFSRDTEKDEKLARRVEAGAVCVNDAIINFAALELPMGGVKVSGLFAS